MSMDLEQYRDKLNSLDQAMTNELKGVVVVAAGTMLAKIKNRITRQGKDSYDSLIGHYSTKPMYATRGMFDKVSAFKPGGKTSKKTDTYRVSNRKKERVSVSKSFRPTRSMFLPDGYKQLRSIQGKPVDKVNLLYRGDLIPNGYQLEAREQHVVLGFVSERFKIIREGLEKKFGGSPIFQATSQEMEDYNREVTEETSIINNRHFAT